MSAAVVDEAGGHGEEPVADGGRASTRNLTTPVDPGLGVALLIGERVVGRGWVIRRRGTAWRRLGV